MERLKLKISASFWVFVVCAVIFKHGYFVLLYTLAVTLHEIAHYVVASKLFYRCTEIRIGIFGATLYGDFQDVDSVNRVKIALAGPVCNAILCLLCLALWWMLPDSYYFTETFFTANLSMALVNLLPCYPLDGGRVLTGILDRRVANSVTVTKYITVIITLVAFAVFVISLFTRHNLFTLGLFAICLFSGVINTNGGECYVKTTFCRNINYYKRHGMEKKTLVFYQRNKLSDVAKRMQGNYLYCVEVVDDSMKVIKTLSVAELEQAVVNCRLDTLLVDV